MIRGTNQFISLRHISQQALDPGAAWMTSRLMQEVLTQGTAASARSLGFKLPAAGKTAPPMITRTRGFLVTPGTLTCGVWVGFDQRQRSSHTVNGAALALPFGFNHEQGVTALSCRAVATPMRFNTRRSVRFQSTRQHRMHVRRNRFRH